VLSVWCSIGYDGDENRKPSAQTEPTASRRSPIRRRSPTRLGHVHDPHTGAIRTYRRPLRPTSRNISVNQTLSLLRRNNQTLRTHMRLYHSSQPPSADPDSRMVRIPTSRVMNDSSHLYAATGSMRSILFAAQARTFRIQRSLRDLQGRLGEQFHPAIETLRQSCTELFAIHSRLDGRLTVVENDISRLNPLQNAMSRRPLSHPELADPDAVNLHLETMQLHIDSCEDLYSQIQSELDPALDAVDSALYQVCNLNVDTTPAEAILIARELGAHQAPLSPRRSGMTDTMHQPIVDGQPSPGFRVDRMDARELTMPTPPIGSLQVPMPPIRDGNTLGETSGLGDRTRSASPENDGGAWDTMLTTMEPDAQLPSADSSFTSAAASASFSASATDSSSSRSNSNSRVSSQTDLTIPEDTACESDDNVGQDSATRNRLSIQARNSASDSFGSQTTQADSVSDFVRTYYGSSLRGSFSGTVPASGTRHPSGDVDNSQSEHWTGASTQVESFIREQSHVQSLIQEHQSQVHLQAISAIPRSTSPLPIIYNEIDSSRPNNTLPTLTQPLTNNHGRPESPSRRRIAQYRRYSHSGRSRRALRQETAQPSQSSADPLAHPELEHMRSILQELANSRDIPDEWWLSAGLTPNIALQQSNTTSGANSSSERERL
jgi:hypothetical protein